MKKKILALFCACVLFLGLLVFPSSLAVGDTPCFLGINDSLLALEDRYIPIAIDGQYYIPYTALDSGVTGVSLGIFPIYDAIGNTLMIYNFNKALVFDLAAGTCKDDNGINLNARAVNRNGRIYVPARFICTQFDLTYSSRVTSYGQLVRIRSASSRMDDDNFFGLAQLQMPDRIREWRKSQTEVSAVTPTPTPSATPTPAATPLPEDPEVDKSGVHTYLAFRADQTDGLEELLATLERYQVQALFFFPAAELADYDDDVRRVLCGGHAVGLLVSDTADAAAQAGEGNRVLAQIAYLHTDTLLIVGEEDETAEEEFRAAGWLCWHTDVDALPDGRSAFRQASAVLGSIDLYYSEVYILSDASAAGAALLERLLPGLIESRYNLRLAVETEL